MAKQDTRIRILEAAEKLFSQNGFDGVSTKTLASKAGITEMTLFNHFNNKELLYKTVVKEKFLMIKFEYLLSELTYDDFELDLVKISEELIKNFYTNKNILLMRLKEKQSFKNDKTFTLEEDPMLKTILPLFKLYEKRGHIMWNLSWCVYLCSTRNS